MASQSQIHQLHFLLVPLMSQSHLIPFTEMAKLLAHHGVKVTIIFTPLNAARFNTVLEEAKAANLNIEFVSLRFPGPEAGLPEGCENMDTLPSLNLSLKFYEATSMLQKPLEKWLEESKSLPNCIIADVGVPWTTEIGLKFKIPRLVFYTTSCFCQVCNHNISQSKVLEGVTSDSQTFLVPNMPDRIEFTKGQIPEGTRKSSDDTNTLMNQFRVAKLSAEGLVVNTLEELEPRYVEEYRKVIKNIWCIGPLSLCNKAMSDKFARGNKTFIDESNCLSWLDSMKPSSVIYVCFGSLCELSASQLVELALGLESSNYPFIWVIKKGNYSEELEKWLVEEKFEEKTKGRGLIIRGWAPQVQILSHLATGGFLTHCGWNSTLEGVSAGVPMITWPIFAEQFYNEKLLVQVLRIGVSVGAKASVDFGEEKDKLLVRSEDVKKAIEQLTDKGEEAEERRKRARKLGEIAKKSVEEGGSSYLNVKKLIQYISENKSIIR
ncbi:UDP-glycosyltransferase 73C11-like [Castanea sativa]|uniref:UDP-glycosyltransferase 73C11-like n=1 Tax=Castanea sativa TaxID=21020 RepID=UPI003F6506AF